MSDNEEKKPKGGGETAAQEAPETGAPGEAEPREAEPREAAPAAATDDAAQAAEAAAQDPVAALEAQLAEYKDQLLRALAETENLRRRSQREREDVLRYAAAPLVKDMIEVADNLRRALEAVPPEAVEADEHLKTLMTGVQMTERALQSVFEKHHIRKLDPLGERLDPHFHEAIFEVPDPSQPAGTIVQVVRAGYRLHDRLLRAAQVGVAKGGPASSARPNGGGEETAGGERREPGGRVDTTA